LIHCDSSYLQDREGILGVELLDALIVTDPSEGGAYYSFREAGGL
jgi:hypothetical protein